jgi:hypothetical protein
MAAARVRPQEFQLDASKAPVTKKSFWPKAAAQAGALKVRQRCRTVVHVRGMKDSNGPRAQVPHVKQLRFVREFVEQPATDHAG